MELLFALQLLLAAGLLVAVLMVRRFAVRAGRSDMQFDHNAFHTVGQTGFAPTAIAITATRATALA